MRNNKYIKKKEQGKKKEGNEGITEGRNNERKVKQNKEITEQINK